VSRARSTRRRTVRLRRELTRALEMGQPWVYREALRETESPLRDGDVVGVESRSGRLLGWGYTAQDGPLALRMMGLSRSAAPHCQAPPFRGVPTGRQATQIVQDRLRQALDKRLARLDRAETNTFRWAHGEADGLAGLHVDVYAEALSLRFDGPAARAFYQRRGLPDILATLAQPLPIRHVVDRKPRDSTSAPTPGGEGGTAGDKTADRTTQHGNAKSNAGSGSNTGAGAVGDAGAVDGTSSVGSAALVKPAPTTVLENGLRIDVDLARGQKGGLFLDQRENRLWLAERAPGKRVLNLFGYTGAFALYAARAGADRIDTVDISKPATAAAQQNFSRNGLDSTRAGFHAADAFAFLDAARRSGTRWDIVISDPPSFASSKKALPTALSAYKKLHAACAHVLEPGGLYCAASCSSHVNRSAFRQTIIDGLARAGQRFTQTHEAGAGFDHPVLAAFPEGDYLKFIAGTVSRSL